MRRLLAALGSCALLLVTPVQITTAQAAGKFTPGQCTYWAASVRPDIGAEVTGNAANWPAAARRAGLETGPDPEVDAIVIYQPGVQGAWGAGHAARVLSVSPDGQHFIVDEMNFPVAGRVTQRTSHVGPGVSFIY